MLTVTRAMNTLRILRGVRTTTMQTSRQQTSAVLAEAATVREPQRPRTQRHRRRLLAATGKAMRRIHTVMIAPVTPCTPHGVINTTMMISRQ